MSLGATGFGNAAGPSQANERQEGARTDSYVGLLPIMIAIPLMYWPKLLESDTQPWVVIGALLAFLWYWPARTTARASSITVALLAAFALAAYWAREPDFDFLVRYAAILGTFVMLWEVASRSEGNGIATAVRITIVVWFLVGLYQTAGTLLGWNVEIFGRYTPGRSGVPSLTAEPSFYGSISVLHIMYLVTEQRRRNQLFIALAVVNVLMSGSLLSFLLLLIPAARLPLPYKVAGAIMALMTIVVGVNVLDSPFFTRLASLDFGRLGPELLALDQSLNLRWGNIWFTFVVNLMDQLTFESSVDFFLEYNSWALSTGEFIIVDSDFILPSGGELLFRSGLWGLLILTAAFYTAYRKSGTTHDRVEKLVFLLACFLNPVSITNPVFIFYIHKRYGGR